MNAAAMDAGITAIGKRSATLMQDVQKIAVSILRDMKQHGDKPTAVKRANGLCAALGAGMRANALRLWFETLAPMVWNDKEKTLTYGHSATSPVRDTKDIDVDKCIASPWQLADGGEKPYKPIDNWSAQLASIIKRAHEDIKAMGDKSKVNKAQLLVLEGMAEGKPLATLVGAAN
jgi:hypothetical protein